MRSFAPGCVLLLAAVRSGAAEAACEITDVAPTGVIPTMPSQPFSFVATNDCTMLSFTARPGMITKTPRPGMAMGADRRRYTVSLTVAELNAIANASAATFSWTVTGRFSGTTTRVTTVNDLDFDGDGWTRADGDAMACDLDDARNPSVPDVCGNGVDEDCDGADESCDVPVADADLVIEGENPTTDYGIGFAVGIGDLDADGAADVLLGERAVGLAHVVYGPASGVIGAGTGATFRAHEPGSGGFGAATAAGDADGDGFADALVGAPGRNLVHLFLGPITGDRDTYDADAQFVGRDDSRSDYTGGAILVGFDHDGDGQSEIAVGSLLYKADDRGTGGHSGGAVYVVPGSATGTFDMETDATYLYIGATGTSEFGTSMGSLGDWNGDGIAELAMGGPREGSVYVVEGGGTPGRYYVDDVAAARIGNQGDFDEFGWSLAAADYDGDGTSDLVVGEPGAWAEDDNIGMVMSFLGPLAGSVPVTDADTTWVGEQGGPGTQSAVGAHVAVGDVDGDDASDVIMGDPWGGPEGRGAVYLQLGPSSGTVEVADLQTFASADYCALGEYVGFVPDWLGDGNPELLFGAPTVTDASDMYVGAAYVFFSETLFP